MKRLFTIIFLTTSLYSIGQPQRFKNGNEFGIWTMNYYKNPEPNDLFDAFIFATESKEIAQAGSRGIMMSFFASALRNDTIRQQEFFDKLQTTKDENLIYGFGYVLWLIHTEFSLNSFEKFKNLNQIEKYKKDFDSLTKGTFLSIYTDPITKAEHLDMLWADFFATGNEESIKKIITKLIDIDSANPVDKVTAGSAKWSLTSNSIRHDRVFETCKTQRADIADNKIKMTLDEIIKEATKQRGG
jgi:hypothetical protein